MRRLTLLFILLSTLLAACNTPNPTAQYQYLKLAVIPVIDTLPMFVAQSEGLFAKNHVNVELIPVASASERDQLIQAGQADGTLNETLAVMLFNKDKIQMEAVRYGLMATQDTGHFFILVSANSGITNINALKGVEIGISQGTIIDYVTTRLLQAKNFKITEIKTIAVPKISDRMSLLASGQLKAAVMPDPFAALAIQQGSKIILDDTSNPKLGASVISFRKEIIDGQPDAIKSFLSAIEEAVGMINTNPNKYAHILEEKKIVPQPLVGKYSIPKFPQKGVPTEAEWNDVLLWAQEKNLISANVLYKDSINPTFLP